MSYSASKKTKILKEFDKTAELMQDFLVERYGEDLADRLYKEARLEYEELIPKIPYINGMRARSLNSFLLITAQELAVYRTMKKHDKSPAETWGICHEAITRRMEKFSKFKRWFIKRFMFSNFLMRRVRKRAKRGQQLKFGDFEIRYIAGDGKEFDWGVDYVACGNYNFMKSQGAEEFAPYVCMSDIALSDALEWGLTRTQTLADGCQSCDFRFKKGSKTRITSKTSEVQETIENMLK